MKIEKIIENKKQFLDLLLLADEQENMIDKYLASGDLFALYDDDLKSICVVVPIDSETCELKDTKFSLSCHTRTRPHSRQTAR